MAILDDAIGRLISDHPDATVLLSADHGMNAKSRMVDLKAVLAAQGIESNPVPIIKDRYTVHHSNLGGCMFVHLDPEQADDAIAVFRDTPGVDEALPREEAAARLSLRADLIGDVVVEADRRHGVRGRRRGDDARGPALPRLAARARRADRRVQRRLRGVHVFEENRDVGRYVFERVLV